MSAPPHPVTIAFRNSSSKRSKHIDEVSVFAIMQPLSDRDETGISELSVRLAMPKATVYCCDISRQLGCTAFPLGVPESTRSTR